jgi:hypothetical protein
VIRRYARNVAIAFKATDGTGSMPIGGLSMKTLCFTKRLGQDYAMASMNPGCRYRIGPSQF